MTTTNPEAAETSCAVCGNAHGFQWTDTHGVGVCYQCAAPYTIFHYDESGERVSKPPLCALVDTGLALAKRYWAEIARKVFPGCCDIGFLGGRETTYSGATRDDMASFEEWYDQQPEVIARRAESLEAA